MKPSSATEQSPKRDTHTHTIPKHNGTVNPIRRSAVMVDWESVFTALFRKISPERISEVKEVLSSFEGMYEAGFTSLCRHYGTSVPIEYQSIPIDPASEWTKLRVARLLIRNVGANIFHLPQLDDAMHDLSNPKTNPNIEFDRLESKFGPEPPPSEPFSFFERVTLACAMNGKMEVRHRYTAQLNIQSENPDIAFQNAIDELPSGEYFWDEVADPRDIRARLRRFLTEYDKPLLAKMDALLDAAEDPISLFTQLQRAYGREPKIESNLKTIADSFVQNEATVDDPAFSSDAPPERYSTHQDHPESTKVDVTPADGFHEKDDQSLQAVANQALHLEALRNDIFIMPKSFEYARDPSLDYLFDKLADYILQAHPVGTAELKHFTLRIFNALDRSMLTLTNALILPRVDPRHKYDYETQEWLQFLHCFYLNAIPPQANNVSLRTVVSLLYMKLGGAIWEVKAAGGVDAFMDKAGSQDAQEQQDRAFNLRVMYGSVPDESDLAERNKKRIYFHYYNPSFPIEKIDAAVEKLLSTNKEGRRWEDIFRNLFGPPPRPVDVSEKRVRNILKRFAHTKEDDWKAIADAHTDIGDTPESVIRNLVRTYGPERSEFDRILESKVLGAECEDRFRIFSHEMRTRDVILRRASAALSSGDGKKTGTRALDQRLQMQKMLVAKSAEEERKRQEKSKNDLKSLQLSQIDTLLAEEDLCRKDIEIEERAVKEPIVAEILRIFPQVDTDVSLDISETVLRHIILDDSRAAIKKLKEQMRSESLYLQTFLADRLLWRKKWERDEEIRIAILEMKDFENRQQLAKPQLSHSQPEKQPDKNCNHHSIAHDDYMKELYGQLNAQTSRNLSFQVEVENNRAHIRSETQPGPGRPNASRMRLPNTSYSVAQKNTHHEQTSASHIVRPTAAHQSTLDTNEPDPTEDEMNFLFLEQLREYLQNLFRKYDPKLEGTEKQLLSQYIGNEAKLIAALEQQYNVDHWMEAHLHHRLSEYYRRMAPESMDEIPAIIQRFIGNEEAMWAFLRDRHGPVPLIQSMEMQKYIRARFLRYFSRRAPELIQDIDKYIIMIGETNGDAVFRDLASNFGPEEPQIQLDTLIRKLRRFYRERGIRRQYDDIPTIARRFLGHESLLNRLLQEKFDDDLHFKHPDVADFL